MKKYLDTIFSVSGISLVVITASILAVFYSSLQSSHASSMDWLSEGATADFLSVSGYDRPGTINHPQQCHVEKVLVGNDIAPRDSCVYQAKSFRFGWVHRYADGQDKSSLAISLGTDSRFYMIANLKTAWWHDEYWYASSESDNIVFSNGDVIMIFKDVPGSIERDSYLGDVSYRLRYPDDQYTFDGRGRYINMAMSANGEWLVGNIEEYGVFRAHVTDGSVRLIAGTAYRGMYHFGIDNDGSSVVVGGVMSYADTDTTSHAKIFSVNSECGTEPATFWKKPSQVGSFIECPSKSLNDMLEVAAGNIYGGRFVNGIQYPKFNDTGDAIDLLQFHGYQPGNWVRLYKPGYIKPLQLEYLA